MANQSNREDILKKDWSEVRGVLRKSPATRGEESSPEEKYLRDYFGEERFRELRELAQPKNARKTREELGNVVLLPGIMGSHLAVVDEAGDEEHIWVNLWNLVWGGMKRLKLKADGKTTESGETVKATGLIGWYYALALESLQAEPFPYDWRVSVVDTADELAAFVEKKFADGTFAQGKPVHFVAHSMGGLVVRAFAGRHSELWKKLDGRLVMLGTPNAGSFAAIQTLMGKNSLVKNIAAVLPFQSKSDWYEIINSFPGLYQLCPSQTLHPDVYLSKTWSNFPDVAFNTQLQLVPKFHQDLQNSSQITIDRQRMSYIAGVGFETPSGLKTLETGDYDFDTTLEGDGTVPHALGLLEGITTYYVEDTPHGSLLNNHRVLQAVRDILIKGDTEELTTIKPVVVRSRGAKATPVIQYELEHLEDVAQRIRKEKDVPQEIIYDAEKILLRSMLGGKDKVDDDLELISLGEKKPRPPVDLDVRFVFGDVSAIDTPVIVVGQFENVPPGGACAAVDRKVNNLISRGYENNMLGTGLGQLFFLPLANQAKKQTDPNVEAVVVAGMGEFGSFSREDLRYLMMNTTLAILGLGYDTFGTVMVGASIDTFSVERGLRSIWFGINDAIDRLRDDEQVGKITLVLVESNEGRQKQILNVIKVLKKSKNKAKNGRINFKNLRILLHEKEDGAQVKQDSVGPPGRTLDSITRLTVERRLEKFDAATSRRERGRFDFTAFTSNAAIPVRDSNVNDTIISKLIDELRYSNSGKKQENYGKLLHSLLMPEDFQGVLDSEKSLVLVVNREASVVPWEMLSFGGPGGAVLNFGVNLRVSRQFGSHRVHVPSAPPPLNKQFKALIIADPAAEPELQLSGARREGIRLKEYFRELQTRMRDEIDLDFQACIGAEECDIVKILNLIFNEEFDIIHFAGHGTFDERDPTNSGWVFGKDLILSANEIFRLRRVPRLVFANACFSAGLPTVESNRQLAGLAEAFFDRGIENYIGAGWQVSDEHAIEFARTFYENTIEKRESLGEALSLARKAISPHHKDDLLHPDSTWGAYQHYGDPNARLVRDEAETRAEADSPKTKAEDDKSKSEKGDKKNNKEDKEK